jgi:hypothetical protein
MFLRYPPWVPRDGTWKHWQADMIGPIDKVTGMDRLALLVPLLFFFFFFVFFVSYHSIQVTLSTPVGSPTYKSEPCNLEKQASIDIFAGIAAVVRAISDRRCEEVIETEQAYQHAYR